MKHTTTKSKPKRINQKRLKVHHNERPVDPDGQQGVLKRKPVIPKWLTPEARRVWRRVAPPLAEAGHVCVLDETHLGMYCDAYVQFFETRDCLEVFRNEPNIDSRTLRHATRIHNNAWKELMSRAEELMIIPDLENPGPMPRRKRRTIDDFIVMESELSELVDRQVRNEKDHKQT